MARHSTDARRHRLERACLRRSTREIPRLRCRAIRPVRPSVSGAARRASAPSCDDPCRHDIPRPRHRARMDRAPTAGMPISSDGVAESMSAGCRAQRRRTAESSGRRSPPRRVAWLLRPRPVSTSPSPQRPVPSPRQPHRHRRAGGGLACRARSKHPEACARAAPSRACLGSRMTRSRPQVRRLGPRRRPSPHRLRGVGSRRSTGSPARAEPRHPMPRWRRRSTRRPRPPRPRHGPLLRPRARRRNRVDRRRERGLRRRIPMPFSIG